MTETISFQLEVPKETKEAIDFIAEAVDHFKSGKGIAEVGSLLDELIAAVEGVAEIDDEFKSEHKEAILAYLVHRVGGLFI